MTRHNYSLLITGLFIVSSGSGCGYSEEEMAAKDRQITELQAELQASEAEASRKLDELSARNKALLSRLHSMGENVGLLQTNLDETTRALEELRARERQQQERLATFRTMMAKFKSMIDSGKLRVRITRNRMVVELPESILFDSGKDKLKDQGEEALAEVAEVLKTIPNREFQVAGHTDNVPIRSAKFPSNWELSTARAVNVSKFLIEKGMNSSKLSAAGHAETQPVASNDKPEGRAQNRRIEIVLMPNLDELPDLSSLESNPS